MMVDAFVQKNGGFENALSTVKSLISSLRHLAMSSIQIKRAISDQDWGACYNSFRILLGGSLGSGDDARVASVVAVPGTAVGITVVVGVSTNSESVRVARIQTVVVAVIETVVKSTVVRMVEAGVRIDDKFLLLSFFAWGNGQRSGRGWGLVVVVGLVVVHESGWSTICSWDLPELGVGLSLGFGVGVDSSHKGKQNGLKLYHSKIFSI